MPLIVKYNDGSTFEDWSATSHDDEEDSYSIADAVNSILSNIQLSLEDKGYVFEEDLCEEFGIESVTWDERYYEPPDNNEVANFLHRFHDFEHDVTYTFIHGCCYWFAIMMHERFPGSRIMLCKDAIHFVTEIDGRLYDITGDVTDKYEVEPWDEVGGSTRRHVEEFAVYWDEHLF